MLLHLLFSPVHFGLDWEGAFLLSSTSSFCHYLQLEDWVIIGHYSDFREYHSFTLVMKCFARSHLIVIRTTLVIGLTGHYFSHFRLLSNLSTVIWFQWHFTRFQDRCHEEYLGMLIWPQRASSCFVYLFSSFSFFSLNYLHFNPPSTWHCCFLFTQAWLYVQF